MQLTSGVEIPDGLLAAMSQLAENSRQGFGAWSGTVHQGFGFAISSTSLGISGTLYDAGVESRYTGKERDAESGLDYFGARYYGSSMGRFMSPDWSDETDPVPYADLKNPQSLNLYSYVHNNPLRVADPDGHDGDDDEDDGDPQQAGAIPLVAPIAIPSVFEMVVGAIAAAPEAIGAGLVFGPAMAFPKDLDCGCLTPAQQAAYAAKSNEGESAGATHTTGARESTRKKHEQGQSRKKKDRGGEKGDKNRRPNRKPPMGPNGKKIKGPWPPRNTMLVPAPVQQDNSTVTTTQQDNLPPPPKQPQQ
jgi:RHS repeat-associated protein